MTNPSSESSAPYYLPIHDEIDVFEAAYACRLPVLLKGPTGCGKTRFVEYMSHRLLADAPHVAETPPLVTVACHEDLTGSDLTGVKFVNTILCQTKMPNGEEKNSGCKK